MFITRFRRQKNVLAAGKYKCLIHDKGVFVFERYDENEKIIIAVNLSQKGITLKLKENIIEYTNNIENNIFNIDSEDCLILVSSY